MRILLTLLCVLVGVSSAVAQPGGDLSQQLQHCRFYVGSYEARVRVLEGTVASTQREADSLRASFEASARVAADSDVTRHLRRLWVEHERYIADLKARVRELRRRVDAYMRYCAELEAAIAAGGPRPGARPNLGPQRAARLARNVDTGFVNAERAADRARGTGEAYRRWLAERGGQLPQVGSVQPPAVWDGYYSY